MRETEICFHVVTLTRNKETTTHRYFILGKKYRAFLKHFPNVFPEYLRGTRNIVALLRSF